MSSEAFFAFARPISAFTAAVLRPFISVNFAISADAKISTWNHTPSGWTSETDSERLMQIRRDAQAILVGRGTQEADNMSMTIPRADAQPWRCILSKNGNFDNSAKVFHTKGGPLHLIVTEPAEGFSSPHINATIHHSLEDFFAYAVQHDVKHLLCEGGGSLVKYLAELDVIDRIYLTWAGHTLIGGKQAPSITGLIGSHLPASRHYELITFTPLADDKECFLTYERRS